MRGTTLVLRFFLALNYPDIVRSRFLLLVQRSYKEVISLGSRSLSFHHRELALSRFLKDVSSSVDK